MHFSDVDITVKRVWILCLSSTEEKKIVKPTTPTPHHNLICPIDNSRQQSCVIDQPRFQLEQKHNEIIEKLSKHNKSNNNMHDKQTYKNISYI